MQKVTVLITVGPQECYRKYLPEAIESVLQQTELPGEILIIDDGSSLTDGPATVPSRMYQLFPNIKKDHLEMHDGKWAFVYEETGPWWVSYWHSPWNIGFAQAYNCGIGLSLYENIIYLGADDRMMPTCVEDCMRAYEKNNQKDAWYACSYEINGETHTIPVNYGMVTRNLWRWLGGYPPAAFAGPDAALLSILMVHAKDRIIWVEDGKANYWGRVHDEQETKRMAWPYSTEMTSIRGKLTDNFKPKEGIVLR